MAKSKTVGKQKSVITQKHLDYLEKRCNDLVMRNITHQNTITSLYRDKEELVKSYKIDMEGLKAKQLSIQAQLQANYTEQLEIQHKINFLNI